MSELVDPTKQDPAATPAPTTPDKASPAADPVAAAKAKAELATPAQQPAKAKAEAKDPDADSADSADDDTKPPKPDSDGFVKLPLRKFMQRVGRMTKRELKKHFGTDDLESIVKEREELKLLREDKAERERKAMSDKERLEADLKTEKDKREAAERRADEVEESHRVDRAERAVSTIAAEVIAPKYVDAALDQLAKYMRRNPREIRKDAQVREWLADYAKEHPEIAVVAADPAKPAAKKKPLDDGPTRVRPAAGPSGGQDGQKTAKPGQGEKTLTKQELAAQGYRW